MNKCCATTHKLIVPGWRCCRCRTYNSLKLKICRNITCKHALCVEIEPVESSR